jgi:hypothetical protein
LKKYETYKNLEWAKVEAKANENTEKLCSLNELEHTIYIETILLLKSQQEDLN